MALSPRQRRRRVAARRAGRDGPGHPRGGARAAPPRIPGGAAGVGSGGAYLARGGRQCELGVGGDVVRATHPTASPAAMTGLAGIVAALERAQLLVGTPDLHTWPELSGLTADSRKVARGMLYCAVRGSVQDGHQFVSAARDRGAAAALVEREQGADLAQILVRDGRRAAAVAAETWYDHPAAKLNLVGVTGTNGKTTSVALLRHVLSALEPTGSIGTLGAFDPSGDAVPSEAGNLTTPGPIDLQATLAALVARGARGAAMEVSSHSLDQGRVDRLVFRAGVFTNFTRDHLDYHKTLDDYFRAKAKLLGYIAPDGLEVVNADDPAWVRLRRSGAHRRVTFGEREGDVTARRVSLDATGARFELVTPMGSAPVHLPLLGRFNVANALGVAACAWGLGVPVDTVAECLTDAPQVPGRMERIAERPTTVLRDYAHTADALERAIETLRPLTTGRLIVVFGAGGDRDRGKRAPMGEITVRLADLAIATSDNPRTEDPERILDEVEAGMRGKPHERQVDRRRAIARALELARPGDTVLLAGKGHETYQVIGTEKQHFDEREVVHELGAS
ncbi:MAG: UDP-N-acetylmuramoyl-L-alanyl-D-glutamate--2,6-diaminopimelate ligase [Gemmatimonadetes bacterium]|nr:MAG: UDP-N-acetylmuramoyl-L-alanyl-D-glutamate--2,6-diaminopimelate ligase [Gemmatimonadota bacterium]TLY51913.1 MAG: UDP-N-acetylmuramoyl-L-alanyl-D-glutamate--2,6-diaminopimelate ligase [Gemmatimonadota bacterium]